MSAKANRAAIAELKGRLGTGYVPVNLAPFRDAVAAAGDALRAGRPFSRMPAKSSGPLSPAAQRMMKRTEALREALKRDGVRVWE